MSVSRAAGYVFTHPLYVPEKDLQLQVSIRNIELETAATPVLVVEIKATGRLEQVGKSVADAWFERAHDAIIDCFVGITSKEVQHKYWKPVGEDA